MENNQLQRKEHLTGLIATLTNIEKSREFERSLTLDKIVESAVPISQLKQQVGARNIAIALDIQLTRLVASLNLKWNINDTQIKDIVQDLLEEFPNETIEDFVLCFKNARKGKYGELIRLDSPVIFGWMKIYLDEKYQLVESRWKEKKDEEKKPVVPVEGRDWLQVWKEAVDALPKRTVIPMTEKEMIEEGAEKKKEVPYPSTTSAEAYVKDRHFHYIRLNYEARTAEKLPTWIPEDEFNRQYDAGLITL